MIKQWAHDETADQADWLIGEDCLFPDIRGVALRSLKDPGSAYNDPAAVSSLLSWHCLPVSHNWLTSSRTGWTRPTGVELQ
jgi:hypothetical protein